MLMFMIDTTSINKNMIGNFEFVKDTWFYAYVSSGWFRPPQITCQRDR